jgi:hypothetical protein
MTEDITINASGGDYTLVICRKHNKGYDIIYPTVEDGVKWETERQGTPGKLTFKLHSDKNKNVTFSEGDGVLFIYHKNKQPVNVFNGYVFTKKRDKDDWITVTAYDQLRYLKNKATYVYTNKRASDVVRMIAKDYKLDIGGITPTKYVIGSRAEDNQSLFDIIQNALDLTLISTNMVYVLYAHDGKLYLQDANDMKRDIVINKSTASSFEYTSTIDDETYNEIELYYDNDETNKREYFHAVNETNVGRWGRLRLTESLQNPANAKHRVKQMLRLYNKPTRKLTVKGAFGDYRCWAGSSVPVDLDLGDIKINNYMLIEKATHTFKNGEYTMDLTLSDARFTA